MQDYGGTRTYVTDLLTVRQHLIRDDARDITRLPSHVRWLTLRAVLFLVSVFFPFRPRVSWVRAFYALSLEEVHFLPLEEVSNAFGSGG